MSADTPALGPDAEMAALWAAYAALRTLTPRAQGRAIDWIEARLQDEADRAAGGASGWVRVGPRTSPDTSDIPF